MSTWWKRLLDVIKKQRIATFKRADNIKKKLNYREILHNLYATSRQYQLSTCGFFTYSPANPYAQETVTFDATAESIIGETNLADNTYTNGKVIITIKGDVNGDGKVNILDIATVASLYNTYPGHPKWNPNADLDDNHKIDIIDIAKAAKNYGKTDP